MKLTRSFLLTALLLVLLGGMAGPRAILSAPAPLAAAAPSEWYVRGDFNGWGTTDPLYDDGTHGDLVPADNIFTADVTVATAGRSEWKVGDETWSQSWPTTGNSWVLTTQDSQVVRFTFDRNTYADGWAPTVDFLNANDAVTAWTAVGDWQAWNNADPATAMVDLGYGRFFLAYTIAAAGDHQFKAVRTGTWDAVGADNRSANADTVAFQTTSADQPAYFFLDTAAGRIRVVLGAGGPGNPPSHDNDVWWDGLEHNSRDSFYRAPFGAEPMTTTVTLRFRTYHDDVTNVLLRVWDTAAGGETVYPMAIQTTLPGDPFPYDIWEVQLTTPGYLTVLWYRFIVIDGSDTDYYEDDDLFDGALGKAYDDSPDYSWQIDVYDPAFTTPDWFKDGVVYQILPDRFRNGVEANDPISGTFFYAEDPGVLTAPLWNWIVPDPRVAGSPWFNSYSKLFYGGDLQGVLAQLDYLQDLGVTVLYFNPIFESPSNHKYDTTSYEVIDDNLGDLATFQALAAELEARGMYMVLDGVFNHTSSDSIYFDRYGRYDTVGACEDVNSLYRSWYYFTPADPPGSGVCAGDTDYQAWWGFDSLPKLNTTDNEAVRDYIYRATPGIATYWLTQGAGGWRLDVAGDVAHSFWKDWRSYIRGAKPTAITIAEEWGDASAFILGDELDSSMNYRFRNALIGLLRDTDWEDTNSYIRALSVSQFDSLMHSIEEDYPPEAWYALMNLVDSHDTNRVLIPLDQDGDPTDPDYSDGKARLHILALIQLTMPGAPTIYYGDEVGLVGYGDANGGTTYYSDPYNRQPFPWPDEDGYGQLPAWRQQDAELLAYYTALANIRQAHPALRTGSFDTLLTDDDSELYAYGRKGYGEAAVVVANMGPAQDVAVDVSAYLLDGITLTDVLNGNAVYTVTGGQIVVPAVPQMRGAVLVAGSLDLTPPLPPTNLAALEGDGAVFLTWDAVTETATYNLYRSLVSGGGYVPVAADLATTAYTDTTVVNGTWYYYVVTAEDPNGNESAYSNEAAALPHYHIDWANLQWPLEITHTVGVTPTPDIYGQVYILDVTSLPGATPGLLAQVGFGPVGEAPISWTIWVEAIFNTDAGYNDEFMGQLTPESAGEYHYLYRYSTTQGRDWVYADNSGIITPNGVVAPGLLHVLPADDQDAPETPLNLRVTDWDTSFIALAWDPVAGDPTLYAYDLYRSEVSGTVGAFLDRVLAPATAYTDYDVMSGQTYYYVVQAVDAAFNRSGYSNQAWATAEAKEVAVTFQVVVPWYTPADATVYVVGDRPELCGWCDPQTITLTKVGDITWTRVITLPDGAPIQYKYTRGNWNVNEWWGPITGLNNRHATVDYGSDGTQLLADTAYYWRDPLPLYNAPLDGATEVPTATVVTATLSRYLDPATITTTNVILRSAEATPTVEIGFFHHTEMTATTILLTPTLPLEPGTLYTVTLKTGLAGLPADNEAIPMQQEHTWSFRTAGTVVPPTYTAYLPLVMKGAGR